MDKFARVARFAGVAGVAGLCWSLAPVGRAQQPAANPEIYLARLGPDGRLATNEPLVNLSSSPGYDNQPSFTPDGRAVLFASERGGRRTDIYRYDLASAALTQLTRTDEAEYSPLVTPDGRGFSVIRVEADGAQRLWRFDLDGSNPRLVLEGVKPVGYHVWIDDARLALFVLGGQGQPSTLQLADARTGTAEVIDRNIGRSLLRRPGGGTVSYVSKSGERWTVKLFDPASRQTAELVATPERSEDAAWQGGPATGRLLMAQGTTLLGWTSGATWTELGDFAAAGVTRVTRLAVSPTDPTRLALVAEPAGR